MQKMSKEMDLIKNLVITCLLMLVVVLGFICVNLREHNNHISDQLDESHIQAIDSIYQERQHCQHKIDSAKYIHLLTGWVS